MSIEAELEQYIFKTHKSKKNLKTQWGRGLNLLTPSGYASV